MDDQDYIPPVLFELIASYAGISFPMQDSDPVSHILQTVLEPMDINNILSTVQGKHFYLGLDDWDDPFHGGDSAYSLVGVLSNKAATRTFFKSRSTENEDVFKKYSTLEINYEHFEINPEEQPVQIISNAYSEQRQCFMYNLFIPDRYSTSTNSTYSQLNQKRCK